MRLDAFSVIKPTVYFTCCQLNWQYRQRNSVMRCHPKYG